MKIHRFIIFGLGLDKENLVVDDFEFVHQIRKILKLRVGEEVVIGDGAGSEETCLITGIDKEVVNLQVLEKVQRQDKTKRKVTLYCAVLKRDNFEWACQKATEVGVVEIVPIITERTVKLGLQRFRLEKIIKEAAEQCGRAILAKLREPVEFEVALELAAKNHVNVFFDLGSKELNVKDVTQAESVGIFVGPEGGWGEEERKLVEQNEYRVRSLGVLTLRGETAAAVGSYLAINL